MTGESLPLSNRLFRHVQAARGLPPHQFSILDDGTTAHECLSLGTTILESIALILQIFQEFPCMRSIHLCMMKLKG